MIRPLKSLVSVVVVGYLLLCLGVWLGQRSLIYFPDTSRIQPTQVGLSSFDELVLATGNEHSLYCWWRAPADGRPVILFFHGNGGNVAYRAARYRSWAARGFGVLAFGYPGYGGSGGSPSEASFTAASQQAWRWLKESGFDSNDIIIYGESLGSAVAVKLASSRSPRALVLEAPMSSVRDIASQHYPFLPVRTLLRDPWMSIDHIKGVASPLLVFHGNRDRLIPIGSGRLLYKAASEPKSFVEIAGAGHNNLSEYGLVSRLELFLEENDK